MGEDPVEEASPSLVPDIQGQDRLLRMTDNGLTIHWLLFFHL